MIRLIILLATLTAVTACSYLPSLDQVIPDKRSDYKKAEPLPDLEIPPDLTAEQPNENMTVPGEEGASLSRYQHSRSTSGPAMAAASTPGAGGGAASSSELADQQWVSVPGSAQDVWPKLASFFENKGFSLQLNDAQLGVMETGWSAPKNEDGGVVRDRYQIVSEPGADTGVTVLFITDTRQVKTGEDQWRKQGKDSAAEKQLAGELNVYLNGAAAAGMTAASGGAAPTAAAAARAGAELQDAGDNKRLLSLPDEYSKAWQNTRTALDRAGFSITGSDDAKGLYYISYHDREAARDKGWLSKLAFWKKDGSEGLPYVLSLTGDGDRTKLIILNEQGDWVSGEDADRILALVRDHYNSL